MNQLPVKFHLMFHPYVALLGVAALLVLLVAYLYDYRGFSTKHTRDTDNPQTYWQHWRVAVFKSLGLMWLGFAGVLHGFVPEIKGLQFYTSTGIIKAFRFLWMSGRHDTELRLILGGVANQMISHRPVLKHLETDELLSRPECIFHYCPNSNLCLDKCITPRQEHSR